MTNNIYCLPEISFVGGSTQELIFHTYSKNLKPFGLSGCSANFAVAKCNHEKEPILSKEMSINVSNDDNSNNILKVNLSTSDTLDLYGKYTYQITIKDSDGNVEIPYQGILYIQNNIDKSFVM